MNFSDNLPPASCGVSPPASRLARRSQGGDCKIAPGVLREKAWRLFQALGFAPTAVTALIAATGKAATGAVLQIY